MAPPTVFGVGTALGGQTTSPATVTNPLNTLSGDVGIIIVEGGNATMGAASATGWTQIFSRSQTAATGTTEIRILAKILSAAEDTTSVSIAGTINHWSARSIFIRNSGCTAVGDIVVGAGNGATTGNGTALGITVTADSLILICGTTAHDANSTADFSAWTNANLASITEQMDNVVLTANGGGYGMASGTCAGTTTGDSTFTIAVSDGWNGVHLGFKPVAAVSAEVLVASDSIENGNWYVTHLDQDTPEIEAFWGGTIADSTTTLDSWSAVFVGPPAPDEVQSVQDYADDYPHGHDPEDAWWGNVFGFPDQSADVVPQLFPPAVVEPDETFAAQPTFTEHDFATQVPTETEDYGPPPQQNSWLAPPEAFVPELLAAQPTFTEHDFHTLVPEETQDYQPTPDQSEFLAPPEVSSTELLAAQPTFAEHDFDTLVAEETTDYASPSVLEVPTEILPPPSDAEAQSTQLAEQWFFEDQPTEDYANDPALEVTAAFFPPAVVEPDETFAAQPSFAEHPWLAPEETEDYAADSTLEVPVALLPIPTDADLIAAQPHFGEWRWEDQPTEDYAADSTLEVTSFLIPPPPTDAEILAAQPLPEIPWRGPEETEDYAADPALDVTAQFFPPIATEPTETFAAQPHYGEADWPEQETEDYASHSALEVIPLAPVAGAVVELVGVYSPTLYQSAANTPVLEAVAAHTPTVALVGKEPAVELVGAYAPTISLPGEGG